ncbi:MAG TPA: hypothetical protein VK843_20345 [Planctomycetota bacterium]|nr:hypothetical protein [Planctomycetota bacterium]
MNLRAISKLARSLAAGALPLLAASCVSDAPPKRAFFPIENLRGAIFTPSQVQADAKRTDLGQGPNAVVLAIDEQGSYRAAANAVTLLRERGLAVGYWIELSPEDPEAELERLRDLLQNRPEADAIFLAGLQGEPAACGCGSFECCGRHDKTEQPDASSAARFIASVPAFARGAIVVPVWLDGCAPHSVECARRDCQDPACEQRATLAWNALLADSARVALQLRPAPLAKQAGVDSSAALAARLRVWMGIQPLPLSAAQTPATTIIAVLSSAELGPDELARAIAGVRLVRRTGLLIDYRP